MPRPPVTPGASISASADAMPLPDWRLRPATPADTEFLNELKRAALGESIDLTWGWDEARQRELFAAEMEITGTEVIVLGGEDVGVLQTERRPGEIYVRNVLIAPAHQGRGLGTAVLRAVMDGAERAGLATALQVLRVNPRARRLYERLGFAVTAETPTHFAMRRPPNYSPPIT